MQLLKLAGTRTYGLNCDCCVVVEYIEADVFAENETKARKIANSNGIRVTKVEDLGVVEKVTTPGLKVNLINEIYRGYHGDAPK